MSRLRDIDSVERSMLIRLAGLAGLPVLVLVVLAESAFAPVPLWLLVVPDVAFTAVVVLLLWTAIRNVGGLTNSLLMPSGTPPVREYSEQEALIARGDIAGATDSFRSLLVAHPEDLAARLRLGALLAGPGADPDAAERCFLEIRALGPSPVQERVLSNALIDLHRSAGHREQLKTELTRFARLNHRNRAGVMARRYLRQLTREDANER